MIGDNDLEAMFGAAARRECYEVAKDVVREIRMSPATPVDTGDLVSGYEAKRTPDGAEVVQTKAPYWADVEFGHRIVVREGDKLVQKGYQEAQPHVRPAIEVVRARRTE